MTKDINCASCDNVVVLDFETSGLSPQYGDRAIEIGAVKIEKGVVVDRFQQLINPGFRVSSFIAGYTGITNEMLKDAPSAYEVMSDFSDFIEGCNLVAHNASFDKRFLDYEFSKIGKTYSGDFACSLLISRRLYQDIHSHKLGNLVEFLAIPTDGVFHRALADSEMTGRLWTKMTEDVKRHRGCDVSFDFMRRLSKTPKQKVAKLLSGE